MTQDNEAFLDRWSRLKRENPQETPAPVEKAEREEPAAALPPLEELKSDSDFTPFMNPKVDDGMRRHALKKLFADAHFNVPDPFEAYSEDYTQSEPIPELMLRAINKARDLAVNGPEEAKAAEANAEGEKPELPPQEQQEKPAGKQDA